MPRKIQKRKSVLRRVKRSSVGKRKPQVSRRRRAMKGRKMRASDGQPERIQLSNGVEYRLNGKLHRLDGPAMEWADGDKEWYVDGKLHRLDGPAVEWADGYKAWYVDGKPHRLDGPAIERADGSKEWWIDGKEYSEEDFEKKRQEIYKSWLLTNYALLQRGTYHPDVSRRLLGFVTGKM